MNIVITVDPELPVPPKLYGGIERIVDMLVKGLMAKGHQVTLFANNQSSVSCNFIPYTGSKSQSRLDTVKNLWKLTNLLPPNTEIIHSFSRLAYLSLLLPRKIPKLMTYQREPSLNMIKLATKIASQNSLAFTGCSNYISDQIKPFAPSFTVYNGVPRDLYQFNPSVPEHAPLVFLGRIEFIKGTHTAIEIARRTGRRLIIAGNIPPDQQSQVYFNSMVKPAIDNNLVTYIGPVDDSQKNELLSQAAAFLMPIHWNEPFGIVMAEALACGTPVIGFKRGSVPEVVKHGMNGFICETTEDMVNSVSLINSINRQAVRTDFENMFAEDVIISDYETIYQSMIKLGR